MTTLRGLGHEAVMAPMYLPFQIDDKEAASDDLLFFGGINVYLQQKIALFRHTPHWLDALFDSRALLRLTARKAGMTKASELGEMTLSMLKGEQGNQRKELERLLDWIRTQEPFDVVALSNCLLLSLAEAIQEEFNLPVVCTLQGEDGFLDSLPDPYREEAWERLCGLVEYVQRFVAVSYYYGDVMQKRMRIPQEKMRVVQNGISLQGYESIASRSPGRVIGYLARLCDMKGLPRLIEAFIQLKRHPGYADVTLKIAGTMTPSDETLVNRMKEQLIDAGLAKDVEFLPNLNREEKIRFLQSLSVFSVPATYGESFGLYVLEALAAGVPVVQPCHAGFIEIVEQTGGGVMFQHDSLEDYVSCLRRLLDDTTHAHDLGQQGRAEVFRHFHVERMARDIVQVYESVTEAGASIQSSEGVNGIGI
ncbi:MAG: glycosyltransferase family 4 protein [bacterium]